MVTSNNFFGNNGGGAAFGNPTIARQGQTSGATQISNAGAGRGFVNPTFVDPSLSPPKAPAAQAKTNAVYSSLVDALNQNQAKLVRDRKQEIADQYIIEFAPQDLAASGLKKPGEVNSENTAMQNNNTAASVLNPSTNFIDYNSQGWQVTAGTQIVQLIDQVMRSSTYISNQQSTVIDDDGQSKANPSSTASTAWYKISVQATPLGYDHIRHDFAYQLRYVISPYAINQAASQYFPDSRYRGSHKSYNYWFTGLNTQILDFAQEYNNLYRIVISGIGADLKQNVTSDFRDQFRRTYMPTSAVQTQGGNPNYVSEPGSNLADFLYSPTDQAKCRLKIVGDPAWLQQGEVGPGIGSVTQFDFRPFNADGSINYDSQQVVFDISWNRPSDYNLSTGTVDIQNNKYGQPLENVTYTAIKCKSTFNRGRFEQEIDGRALIEFNKNGQSQAAADAEGRNAGGGQSSSAFAAVDPRRVDLARTGTGSGAGSSAFAAIDPRRVDLGINPSPDSTSQVSPSNPAPQPATPPTAPTSNGDINSTNGNTPLDQTVGYDNADQTSQFMNREA
jgi:hypothetical protein